MSTTLRKLIDDGQVHVFDGAMGTILYDKGVRAMDRSETVTGRGTIDLLLYRKGKRVVGYVDGLKVLETETSVGAAVPAIGVAGGSAVFERVSVRRL